MEEFFKKYFLIAVHCRTLHPIFRKIAEKYRENKDIVFARMDLSSFKPVDLKVILPTYVFAYLIYYHVTPGIHISSRIIVVLAIREGSPELYHKRSRVLAT